ncbi:MAG TPA: alpha/beta fold hydrolase [Anaerolineae bacterium]|nr:alpha/beta fold hydrolase [Anaerolineae bacterium]
MLSIKPWLLIILFTLMLVSPNADHTFAQTPQPQRTAAFEPAECMFEFPLVSLLSPAALGFECGYVTVPEQHGRPDGPTIRLAVAVLPSTAENPDPDPFFMAQGGPGGSSLELFPLFMLNNPIRDERDIVIFDQRGTLYSEPNLLCPELDELTKETIELDLSIAESERRSLIAYQACSERLTEEGINLAAFNSLENAADVEAVRVALGYDKINFYGVSYGTLLGLHLMRDYPASLRSVILDAVVPTQGSFLQQAAASADRAFKEVAQLCAADADCKTHYPDLENVIYEVMAALNKKPATVAVTNPDTGQTYQAIVNGDLFISALFLALYDPSQLPIFPTIVYQTRAGDYTLLSKLLPVLIFQPTFSVGMYQTVVCAEEVNFSPAEMPSQGIRPELAALMRDDNETLLDICRLWKIPKLGPEANAPVVSRVPTLLLSGRFDPITPASFAASAAETLSRSYTYTFPNTSHGAFLFNACANSIAHSFLDNPDLPPNDYCLANEPTTFDIPTPATVIMTPAMANVLDILNGQNLAPLGLLLLSLLGLLSFVLVWPLAYLIRKLRKLPPPTRAPGAITWSAAGLVILTGGLSLLFLIGLILLAFSSDLSTLLIGIPKAAAPLFVVPWLVSLLTAGMVAVTFLVWVGRYWPVWRRVYYSLLSLSALVFVGVMARWDMLTVFW